MGSAEIRRYKLHRGDAFSQLGPEPSSDECSGYAQRVRVAGERTIAQEMQASRPVNKRIEARTCVKRLEAQMRLNGLVWPTGVQEEQKKEA